MSIFSLALNRGRGYLGCVNGETQMTKVRLSQVRQAVIDYYGGDMSRHLDLSTLAHAFDLDNGRAVFNVAARSFSDVTGMKKLGSGAYSEVFEIDDKHVLKIVKKTDSGYARFVKICQANRHNPHLPKIHLAAQWAGKQIYILERLSETSTDEENVERSWNYRGPKYYFREAISGRNSENPFFVLPPEIKEVAQLLRNMTNDLHDGNMMFRGNVLVVTDPTTED